MSFSRLVKRVADRFGVQAATAWTREVLRHQAAINEAALRSALASGNLRTVEAVIQAGRLQANVARGVRGPLAGAAGTAGTQGAALLASRGLEARFNAAHPNVAAFARRTAAEMVVAVPAQTKQVIAEVVALGAEHGLTVEQQARAIREVVGLPPNWASAPVNLAQEIRTGRAGAATARRLSAATKQQIRSRILAGTVDEAFVSRVSAEYARSLINRRALNIARTESLRAAHAGLQESWQQASRQGVLPANTRRFWLVTPDSHLSPEHARIPGMNPAGRGLTEPFFTTEGIHMHPPSRPNCRCSVGLMFPPPALEVTPGAPGQPVTAAPDPAALPDEEILRLPSSAFPLAAPDAPETLGRFYANGQFTPERQRLHDAIVRAHFRDVTPVPAGTTPEAMIMGGGPGSGKSVVLKNIPLPNRVKIDPDHIKTLLPEFREGTAAGLKNVATLVHEESSLLAKRIMREATRGRYNVVLDGTGDNSFDNLAAKLAQYRAHGHRIVGNYVTADADVAFQRAVLRGQRTGRFVPETYLREVHRNISSVLPRAMREGLFDELTVWDNNGATARVMVRAAGKRAKILDESAWQRFRAGAQLDNELLRNAFPTVAFPGIESRTVGIGIGAPRIEPTLVRNYLGAYGQEWKAAPLPPGVGKLPFKQCYENASKLVLEHPDWRYVEGIAYSSEAGGLPFYHAWAVTPEGFVVDATWANPAGARYFGVAYDRTAYLRYVTRRKFYGVLGGDAESAERAVRAGRLRLARPTRVPSERLLIERLLAPTQVQELRSIPPTPLSETRLWRRMGRKEKRLLAEREVTARFSPNESVRVSNGYANGYYDDKRFTVVLGKKDSPRIADELLGHELGHAVDHAAGGWSTRPWGWSSRDAEFKRVALAEIDAAFRGRKRYVRFFFMMYPERNWLSELFADLYASQRFGVTVRESSFSAVQLRAMFPKSIKRIREAGFLS